MTENNVILLLLEIQKSFTDKLNVIAEDLADRAIANPDESAVSLEIRDRVNLIKEENEKAIAMVKQRLL